MNFCGLGEHAGVLQQTFERMTRLEPETVAHLAASLTTAEGEELQKARAAVWCHVGESVILGCICVQVIFLWRHASSSLQWPILPAMSVWWINFIVTCSSSSINPPILPWKVKASVSGSFSKKSTALAASNGFMSSLFQVLEATNPMEKLRRNGRVCVRQFQDVASLRCLYRTVT